MIPVSSNSLVKFNLLPLHLFIHPLIIHLVNTAKEKLAPFHYLTILSLLRNQAPNVYALTRHLTEQSITNNQPW